MRAEMQRNVLVKCLYLFSICRLNYLEFPKADEQPNPLIGRRVACLIKPVSRRHVVTSTCERNKQPNDVPAIPCTRRRYDKSATLQADPRRRQDVDSTLKNTTTFAPRQREPTRVPVAKF